MMMTKEDVHRNTTNSVESISSGHEYTYALDALDPSTRFLGLSTYHSLLQEFHHFVDTDSLGGEHVPLFMKDEFPVATLVT